MKKIITLLVLSFIVNSSYCQVKKEIKSKMSDFTSKTGVILKFEDYNLPKLKSLYGSAETKIRKIISGNQAKYFFQISKKGEYDTKTASIAYEDIVEVLKALSELKKQSQIDLITTSNYLENKFVTEDKFKIGYYVNKSKVMWFMKLENYGKNSTLYIRNVELFESAFNSGKIKIEELKIK